MWGTQPVAWTFSFPTLTAKKPRLGWGTQLCLKTRLSFFEGFGFEGAVALFDQELDFAIGFV